MLYLRVVSPPQSLSRGKVTPIWSAKALLERRYHVYTQDLGVGGFQSLKILLEVFHLLGSTTGEGEDVESQHYIFLLRYWLRVTSFRSLPSKYCSLKSGVMSPTFSAGGGDAD